MNGEQRELTFREKATIKKLVVSDCANYCHKYGCLPLEDACVMLHKCWTGAYCKYFQNEVLPLDPVLEAALTGEGLHTRLCAICGTSFVIRTNKVYCSAACSAKAHRKQKLDSIRKKRGWM